MAAVSRDGRWIASWSLDNLVHLWDRRLGPEATACIHGDVEISNVTFIPDSAAALLGDGECIRIIDLKDCAELSRLPISDAAVASVAVSHGGGEIVAAVGHQFGYELISWSWQSHKERIRRPLPHSSGHDDFMRQTFRTPRVRHLEFSPNDSEILLSMGTSGDILIVDADSFDEIAIVHADTFEVNSLR